MISKFSVSQNSISWLRSFMFIKVEAEGVPEQIVDKISFYAVNSDSFPRSEFTVISYDGSEFLLRLCITNAGYNRCLPAGEYRIVVIVDDRPLLALKVKDDEVFGSERKDFFFANRQKKYSIDFFERDSFFCFRVGVFLGEKEIEMGHVNPVSIPDELRPAKRSILSKIRSEISLVVKRPQYDLVNSNADKMRFYKQEARKHKSRKKRTILFLFEQASANKDNAAAVFERMKERGLDRRFNFLFYDCPFNETRESEEKLRKLITYLAKSGTIILVDYSPVLDLVELDSKTKVIQLWHGGAGFKSSGYCRFGVGNSPAPFNCYRQIDFGISGSSKIAEFYSEVWGINDEQIIPTGMPRIDKFLNEENRKKKTMELYELLPIAKGKKVILFAPTFRGDNRVNAYYPSHVFEFSSLYETIGDEYVVLIKMHPWVTTFPEVPPEMRDRIIDVTSYENINDLFYITDLLITDYSSCIFEFSLMKKPMLFYAFDEEVYSNARGFHRPFRENAPGKVVESFSELCEAIREGDFEAEKVEKYVERHFDFVDSGASDRVIDWLILGKLPEKYQKLIDDKNAQVHKMINTKIDI